MKVLNVFGIILAWLLSIALVLLLIAAPVTFSALSLLDTENISEAVTDGLSAPSAAVPQAKKSYGIASLSAQKGLPVEIPSADKILGDLDLGALEDILGGEIGTDTVNKIISSDAAKEIVEAYVGDVVDALTGEGGAPRLDEEKLIQVVEDNIEEIAEIVQEVAPEFSESSITEIKNEIKKAIRENAGKILKSIVTPQQIRDAIFESVEGSSLITELLTQKDQFRNAIFGAIVLLSLLIFLLRLPGFRGLRWLSSDLFTATGLNAVLCVVLFLSSSAIIGLADGIELLETINVNAMIRSILTIFTRGVMLRTVAMLVAAVVLMVLYVILKTIRQKKPKQTAPAVASPAPAYAPAAPVYRPPVTPQPTQVAPAYTASAQAAAPVPPYTAPPVIDAPDLTAPCDEENVLPEDCRFEADINSAPAEESQSEPKPESKPESEPMSEAKDDTFF